MDVLVLIDKLDDLIHNARPVPLTDQVRVDREEIYDLLDQMRATIPEEIKQARWIVKERQEMLAEAKREAERVVKEARDQQAAPDLRGGGLQAGRARRRGDHRGRSRDRAPDPPRRRGLRRRDPLHSRGQPREVPRRGAPRPRPPRRPRGRAGRGRLAGARPIAIVARVLRAAPPARFARRRPTTSRDSRTRLRGPSTTTRASRTCSPSRSDRTERLRLFFETELHADRASRAGSPGPPTSSSGARDLDAAG